MDQGGQAPAHNLITSRAPERCPNFLEDVEYLVHGQFAGFLALIARQHVEADGTVALAGIEYDDALLVVLRHAGQYIGDEIAFRINHYQAMLSGNVLEDHPGQQPALTRTGW